MTDAFEVPHSGQSVRRPAVERSPGHRDPRPSNRAATASPVLESTSTCSVPKRAVTTWFSVTFHPPETTATENRVSGVANAAYLVIFSPTARPILALFRLFTDEGVGRLGASVAGRRRGLPRMEVLTLPIWKTSTCLTLPSLRPDLTTFCRLDELGLDVTGQRLEPDRAVLACRVVEPDQWCRRCGCEGAPRDSVIRRLAHEPLGWRPTTLVVTVRRYRCTGCGHVWRQDTTQGGRAAGEAVASRAAVGAGRHRGPAPHRGPGRRRTRGRVEHRQRRGPGRGQAGPDRRRAPVRRRHRRSASTSTCGGTPGAATSTSP